ncbi:MAG: class I SAM-dependent methyltransferase [Planctomycetota bacterium]
MAAQNAPLCRVASDDEIANPLRTVDGAGWLGKSIRGKKLLCLAAGGGRQSALYAAAGADVTVLDISPAMLARDRDSARQRGHSIRVVEGSMDDLSMFAAASFEIVIHPVSTCYFPQVVPVYREVARVIGEGGLYISQHKTPQSLQTRPTPDPAGHYVMDHAYYRDDPIADRGDDSLPARRLRESGAIEYLHRWEELIGGLCRCGFVVEDLAEPDHHDEHAQAGTFAHRCHFIAPYVRIKARRRTGDMDGGGPNARPTVPKIHLS